MPSRPLRRGLRVLLVEDDEQARRSLQLFLRWNGFEVRAHALAASAIGLETLSDIHLLITAYALEDGDGIGLLGRLRQRGWHGRAVMIVTAPEPSLIARATAAGFHAVLSKPIVRRELIAALVN